MVGFLHSQGYFIQADSCTAQPVCEYNETFNIIVVSDFLLWACATYYFFKFSSLYFRDNYILEIMWFQPLFDICINEVNSEISYNLCSKIHHHYSFACTTVGANQSHKIPSAFSFIALVLELLY
jgi:hypothetical protein